MYYFRDIEPPENALNSSARLLWRNPKLGLGRHLAVAARTKINLKPLSDVWRHHINFNRADIHYSLINDTSPAMKYTASE